MSAPVFTSQRPTPAKVVSRLTSGQRSTLYNLDDEFCVLGCCEPWAIRLCVDKFTRPALVEMRQGEQYKEFRLNEFGRLVRELLTDHGGKN